MGRDLALDLGPLLSYAYIYFFFSNIKNIDNYQSIYVKLEFPLKDIIFLNISLLWKKWDENLSIFKLLLHVTGSSQHFLRSNHLEMVFSVYTYIYMKQPLKQKLINSPITDFSLWCGICISVYRVKKSNVKIEISLFLEFNMFIVLMTFWLLWTGQNVLTPE